MSGSRASLLGQCPCSGATLAKLIQPAIMTVLAEGHLHGYRIVERIAEMPILSGSRPDSTGVYRVLRAMENRGFVVSSWDVSATGPAKRSYRLTAAGKRCLAQWVKTLSQYRHAIDQLLVGARQALKGKR